MSELPSGVTPNAILTALINAAQRQGAEACADELATERTLEKLTLRIRAAIFEQVANGAWVPLGVADPDDLLALRVTARLGRGSVEPPIVVDYDFTKTAKPHIVVAQVAA